MKRIAFVGFLALVLFSCNKNQKASKKLDGTWDASKITLSIETGGGEVSFDALAIDPDAYGILSFTNCNLKSGDFCEASVDIKIADNHVNSNSEYRVIDDGTILVVKDSTGLNNIEIQELNDDFCKLYWIRDEGKITLELEKR
ncbi:hypothetical protein [Crocinitomix catalasitica]|uniref:hypothetical protein n=1 Tax=Crocinitomix catalasitica TaxID=184607 RepID=UPI0004847DDB|nr:hypothetical protein [Crocinitomix catalasitica]